MTMLASPAQAGCSLHDLGNGIFGTLQATWDCKSVCDSEEACAAAVALDAALAGVALEGSDTGKGQALVNQFCKEAQGDADKIVGLLNTIFGNAIAKEVLGDLSSELSSVGSAAKVVHCSCETEQATNSFGFDIGQCAEEVMCDWFGQGCNCTRPAPQTASCPSVDVKGCTDPNHHGYWNEACFPKGSISNTNGNWQNGGEYYNTRSSVAKIDSPQGTLAIQLPPTAEDTGCDPIISCFCPKPMTPAWHQIPNPDSDWQRWIFSCDCPYEADNPDHQTYPGATLPSGISQCLCYNSNQPANFGWQPFGMCPPPKCPDGQTRMSLTGECITPCSDPTQGMAFDGSCCNPSQMTSCGQCCPVGTIPDTNSGTCVPKQIVK
ncbi:hypothetical protein [uncultured Bradyrhizobium sp.]|jgi:hypothetical protein|uniref:hypothetical protein n=1 Tax=uncultured Bradyrhizobium sp. TaxID=199684 RepID=UPI0026188883|nr:hypothetical protein [uncultured Bradyrhizobium sp.]